MRRRLAVPLIAAIGLAPWFWFKPVGPATGLPAAFSNSISLKNLGTWASGFSGIDMLTAGETFYMVTDRGHVARAQMIRKDGILQGVRLEGAGLMKDKNGAVRDFPHTDAEGVAVSAQGGLYVSFEHAQRVLFYEPWNGNAQWPSYTKDWQRLVSNRGLEALAISDDGTLFTLPEAGRPDGTGAQVYRRKPDAPWEQPFTLPLDNGLVPVGADFGPDGRLYILERGIYPFGFYSRVRAMTVTDAGLRNIETVMQSHIGRHGNLEGLSVWQDPKGAIRLTMVSDDNFYFFQRSRIVEYVIADRVAKAGR